MNGNKVHMVALKKISGPFGSVAAGKPFWASQTMAQRLQSYGWAEPYREPVPVAVPVVKVAKAKPVKAAAKKKAKK